MWKCENVANDQVQLNIGNIGTGNIFTLATFSFLFLMSVPLAFWPGGKDGLNCEIMELWNHGNAGLNIFADSPRTIPHWTMVVCTIPQSKDDWRVFIFRVICDILI